MNQDLVLWQIVRRNPMVMLFFSCIDSKGAYQEYSYGGATLESCFEALTVLVNSGWQLKCIDLLASDRCIVSLPVEAFDGVSLTEPLHSLQREWEQLLIQA